MTNYDLGDIVLLKGFPQTDLKKVIKRPALVLTDLGDQDIIVARITGEIYDTPYDYVISNWQEMGLLLPSMVRVGKIATLHRNFIIRKLGKIGEKDVQEIKARLRKAFRL